MRLAIKGILTFVAVSYSVEVNIVVIVAEEHETEPWVKRIDRYDEEDPYDPTLLTWTRVVAQVLVDLRSSIFIGLIKYA